MLRHTSLQSTLDAIRERLVNRSLIIFAILSLPGLAASIARALQTGWSLGIAGHAILAGMLWSLVLLRRQWNASIRGAVFLAILYGVALVSFLSYGISGNASTDLMAFAVIAVLLFGRRTGIIAFLIAEILFILMAIAFTAQWITPAIDFSQYAVAATSWINAIVAFGLFLIAVIVLADTLNSALLDALRTAQDRANQLENLARGLTEEIAERKRTEETLKNREADLVRAQAAAHLGNWTWNLTSKTVSWSEELYRIFGVDPNTFVPCEPNIRKMIHPDDFPLYESLIRSARNGEKTAPFECRHILSNGEVHTFRASGFEVEFDDQNKPLQLFGTVQDITESKQVEKALQFTRFCMEHSADALLWIAPDARFIDLNESACRLLEYSRDELLQRRVFDVNPEFPLDKWESHWNELRLSGAITFETKLLTKSNNLVDVEICANLLSFENLEYNCAFIRDISERKRAERELADAKALLEQAFEQTPIPMVLISMPGAILKIGNSAARQFLGIQDEPDAIGTSFFHYQQSWKDFDQFGNPIDELPLARALKGEITRSKEYYVIRKDGSKRWGLTNASPIYNNNGEMIAAFVAFPDITGHKDAEEALYREQIFTNAVMDSVPGLLYLYDDQGHLVRWNKQHEIITGYSAEELAGMSLLDWYKGNEEDIAIISQSVNKCITEGYAEADGHLQTKNGSVILFHFTAVRLEIDGRSYFAGIGIDISERAKLEEQLAQAQKMESIGRLAGGIAHDFNNILAVILGQGELMQEDLPPDSPLHEDLATIISAGERARDLTRQLLAFSRKQLLDVKIIDLNKVVIGMENMTRRLLGEDITVHTHLRASAPYVQADLAQLEQILMNLFVNARDAMPTGGMLTIETCNASLDKHFSSNTPGPKSSNYAMISVSDTGSGMDEQTRLRIFDPFFTTKEKGKGTGLGLATVYGIVKQHDGEIFVYSEPGHGSTFKVYLPIAQSAPDQHNLVPADLVLYGHGETIVVVEDEPAVRKITCQMLRHLHYVVVDIDNAQKCIEYISQNGPIDLLLSDIVMPGMNGRQLQNQLLAIRPNIKVLFMSGYTEDVIGYHGILEKDVHFLSKPFTEKELSQKIREVLDA